MSNGKGVTAAISEAAETVMDKAGEVGHAIADTAKNPLHRPRKKTRPKKTRLRISETQATCSGRFEDVVMSYFDSRLRTNTAPVSIIS